MRIGVKILVMKEDDAEVQKRLADLGYSHVAEIGAQIDIGKFSANGAGKRRYAEVSADEELAHANFLSFVHWCRHGGAFHAQGFIQPELKTTG